MSSTTKLSDSRRRAGTSGQRVSHGLVALSSAVILSVYSAGYLRTQAAADRLEAEAGQRRPVLPSPAALNAGAIAGAAEDLTAPAPVEAPPAAPAPAEAPTLTPTDVAPPETTSLMAATSPAAPGAPTPAVPNATVTPAAPEAAPVPAATAAPGPAASDPAASMAVAATTAASPAPVADPAPPAAPKYKDGTYTGWGTSRHGDIQAQVVIENGRIVSATIAQCMTRWPCSWIEALPPQVVQRQSPETDFVSGATQSTNAFYYGVVQALGKAALP